MREQPLEQVYKLALSLPNLYLQQCQGHLFTFAEAKHDVETGCLIASIVWLQMTTSSHIYVSVDSWHHCCETQLVSMKLGASMYFVGVYMSNMQQVMSQMKSLTGLM